MAVDDTALGREEVLMVSVESALSADAYGNAGLQVLATPALVGLFERAAMQGVAALLVEGQRTVGSAIELEHQAPTPVGDTVTVRAVISEIDGAKVWFTLSASDSNGMIASGRHARFVIDEARFQKRLERHVGRTDS